MLDDSSFNTSYIGIRVYAPRSIEFGAVLKRPVAVTPFVAIREIGVIFRRG